MATNDGTGESSTTEISKKSFLQLFSAGEIGYYGTAALVYIVLGVILTDKVLNIGVGPLFFVAWLWVVPPVWQWARRTWRFRS